MNRTDKVVYVRDTMLARGYAVCAPKHINLTYMMRTNEATLLWTMLTSTYDFGYPIPLNLTASRSHHRGLIMFLYHRVGPVAGVLNDCNRNEAVVPLLDGAARLRIGTNTPSLDVVAFIMRMEANLTKWNEKCAVAGDSNGVDKSTGCRSIGPPTNAEFCWVAYGSEPRCP